MKGYRKTFLLVLFAVLLATNVYASDVDITYVSTEKWSKKASDEEIEGAKASKKEDVDKFTNIKETGNKFTDEYGSLVYETPDGVRHSFQDGKGNIIDADQYIESVEEGMDAIIDAYENPVLVGVVDNWSATTTNMREHQIAIKEIKRLREIRKKEMEAKGWK